MKKYIYALILLIGLCGLAFADKTTELPETTDPQLTDVLYWVDMSAAISHRSHHILWGTLLDDTKGDGDVSYVWSADKIYDELALKVGTSGDETISGIKTFSSFLITPSAAPTTNYQVANKKYVDDNAGAGVMGAWGASSEITIAAGIAALTGQGYFTLDTEGDGATDDLTQITGLADGDEIIIAPNNDARTVVVKNGANLILCTGADFTMNNTKDRMVLQHIGSNVMVEISRSSGGD